MNRTSVLNTKPSIANFNLRFQLRRRTSVVAELLEESRPVLRNGLLRRKRKTYSAIRAAKIVNATVGIVSTVADPNIEVRWLHTQLEYDTSKHDV